MRTIHARKLEASRCMASRRPWPSLSEFFWASGNAPLEFTCYAKDISGVLSEQGGWEIGGTSLASPRRLKRRCTKQKLRCNARLI